MNRIAKRLALVPAAAIAMTSLLPITAADAAACTLGTPFTSVAAGYAVGSSSSQYWNTRANGTTTVTIDADDPGLHFNLLDENCNFICSHVEWCSFSYVGDLTIDVHNGSGLYTLNASTPGGGIPPLPGIDPPPPGECNLVNTAGICVNAATGNEVERVTVFGPEVGSAGTHRVVGAIDTYRFPLPTGGSVSLPCVVLTANGLGNSDCELAGGTFVNRFATLVDQSVTQPSVTLTDQLATVGICEAQVTVTASGFGVEDFPALTVC